MADDAPAAVVPAPKAAKAPKKKSSKPKAPAAHPKYVDMITKAITELKERGGSSRQAILKYIMKNFKVGTDEKKVNSRVKLALRAGVKSNALKQAKGTGASGSFKVNAEAIKKKPKAKKPKATKPKAAKKPKTPKKAAKKPKTPKKAAKKPAAKKPKTPKKAAKKPAAKKAAKKPAAKKAAAKPKKAAAPKKK